MKKSTFTLKQIKILRECINHNDMVQNLYSPKFGRTYLSDEIQHIRKKLSYIFDISHEEVKREVLKTVSIPNSKRKRFAIGSKWRSKIHFLLNHHESKVL